MRVLTYSISGLLMAFAAYFAITHALPLPFSDAMGAFHREVNFVENKIGLFEYLFRKHGEHFHAGIYALLYLDMHFFHGQQWLLMAVGIASNFAFFALLTVIIRRTDMPESSKLAATLFAALLIAGLNNVESWVFAFQAVLTSFRLCLLIALWLYAIGLEKQCRYSLAGALLFGVTGLFLHGGGVLLPLLLSIVAIAQRRWKWALPPLALYIPFILMNHLADQLNPSMGLGKVISTILQQRLGDTALWLVKGVTTYLGFGLFPIYNIEAAYLGGIGLLLLLVLARRILAKQSAAGSVFIALIAFAMASSLLASLMILSRVQVLPETFHNIYSSRYVVTSALFWIGLLVFLLPVVKRPRMIGTLFLLAGLAGAVVGYQNAQLGLAGLKAPMEKAVAEAKTGKLSKESYIFLMQPARADAYVDRVLAFFRANGKSVFHQ